MIQGQLDENRVRQTVQKVIELKPRGYVSILTQFQRLVKLELEKRQVRVESAQALEAPIRSQIEASLTRKYGTGLKIDYQQNPALVGGLRIQVGSDVYDGSIQARLKQLQDSF